MFFDKRLEIMAFSKMCESSYENNTISLSYKPGSGAY